MISKSLAIQVLNLALSTGGDYAEIYLEETTPESFMLENGHVESSSAPQSYGCGLRILNGFRTVYGYTSDLSAKSLLGLAKKLSASYSEERKITVETVKNERVKQHIHIIDHIRDVPVKEKIDYLKEISGIISDVDPRIVRVQTGLTSSYRKTEIYNTDGPVAHHYSNVQERSRVFMIAIAAGESGIETGFSAPGCSDGWSFFTKKIDYRAIAKDCGEKAIMMLTAKECPSGRYTVVIANGWGGVLFHEACGHPLEASATSKGLSVFSDSIGKPIASPCVSAWDDGTIENGWGSDNVDSEGVPTKKNELIRDGICVGFMVDRSNGRRLGMEPNGTARRQNYRYCPTSRMSNTYIAAGKDNPEDIIKDTPLGIYVANFGGGSVDPSTGEFNFSASEAYIIRDGKICEPVKGCTLIGTGQEVLMQIDRVGNDLALGQGNCGAASGSVPVNVGQPTIRLREITVGGRGGKLE